MKVAASDMIWEVKEDHLHLLFSLFLVACTVSYLQVSVRHKGKRLKADCKCFPTITVSIIPLWDFLKKNQEMAPVHLPFHN